MSLAGGLCILPHRGAPRVTEGRQAALVQLLREQNKPHLCRPAANLPQLQGSEVHIRGVVLQTLLK